MSSFRPRGFRSAKAISNRERQRRANKAIADAAATQLLTKWLLAQAGGKVTISRGTIAQVPADSSIDVQPNPKQEGEVIIRLVLGTDDQEIIAPERIIEVPAETTEVLDNVS